MPIVKKELPESEDDLRPISLTPFFSKVSEHFVVESLMEHISEKIDFRQYGGIKGNSITHYLIEFINFILTTHDRPGQMAVLACYVDFQKAFNRQNHYILMKKLTSLGIPGWLLRIVFYFLKDRSMTVKYCGTQSNVKPLPGGSPQGTLLGLLLFLILINDTGFEGQVNNVGEVITCRKHLKAANELHLKFIDDLTLAEAINLKTDLVRIPECERALPAEYHDRTGHQFPVKNSKVSQQLFSTAEYAKANEMKINFSKTSLMLFNPCTSLDFTPKIEVSGQLIQCVEETRLLGLQISNDLKWHSNTSYLVNKGFKRLWIIRRLKNMGALLTALREIYVKQVRCILELAVPVWNGGIMKLYSLNVYRSAHFISSLVRTMSLTVKH